MDRADDLRPADDHRIGPLPLGTRWVGASLMQHLALTALVLLALGVLWTFLMLRRALSRRADAAPPRPRPLPSLVVIRPVRGLDPGLAINTRAALAQRYPGVMETIFVVDDERDPAYALLHAIIEAHPGVDARVVIAGPLRSERTGKLHAMIRGLDESRLDAPLVGFADSDTRPDPTLLHRLVERVTSSPDIGAAFAPVVCVEKPRTAGDVGYGLLLDGIYGPQAAMMMAHEGSLPFIMGQTMVLRRSALCAAGGLEASEGQLVDDMHIGARLTAAGYRNVSTGAVLPIVSRGLAWREFWSVARRWLIFGRTGIPFWPFNLPALMWSTAFLLGVAGAAGCAATGASALGVGFAAVALSVPVALQRLRRLQGGAPLPWHLAWAPFVVLAALPWIFLRACFARTVVWRGRTYDLDGRGRLGPGTERAQPAEA